MTAKRRRPREEARQLFLSGEMQTNAEIAQHLGVKPHTVAGWRKDEGWDDLRLKVDRRAAEMFVDKIASDRTSLNILHYRFWELLITRLGESVKAIKTLDVKELERIAGILEKAQRGQRLAKGLSTTGETEEQVRAESEAEIRHLIDTFIESVKENVPDEETRDRIRRSLVQAIPDEDDAA